jgi:hypothetical protein
VIYRVLAYAVLGLHFAFTGYVVAGGFLAWRWPRALLPHLVAAAWAALGLLRPIACPLTGWQNTLRERGGQARLTHGFVDTYLVGPLVPANRTVLAKCLIGAVVVISWLGAVRIQRLYRQRQHSTAS